MRAWIAVAVLVVATAALGAWQVLQPALDESNLSDNAVELKLDVEKTQYRLGENIEVTLSVKNKLDHEVTLTFPSSQILTLSSTMKIS